MKPHELVKNIKTREDFTNFLIELQKDFQTNQSSWENKTLDSFLAAVASWVSDSDEYYKNQGQPIPENVNWKAVADMLMGGKIYE